MTTQQQAYQRPRESSRGLPAPRSPLLTGYAPRRHATAVEGVDRRGLELLTDRLPSAQPTAQLIPTNGKADGKIVQFI
jgi:hypothetical protein